METSGKALKRARLATGLKQRQLAAVLEMTPSYLAQIEAEQRPLPDTYRQRLPANIQRMLIDWQIAELKAARKKIGDTA